MNRKKFLKNSLLAGTAVATGSVFSQSQAKSLNKTDLLQTHDFKLKYSPHFGMFENHAGGDLIDQLQFMSDIGFRGLEDNGMKGRNRRTQEQIGQKLNDLGMDMGVFVAHQIYWNEPSLSTGDSEYVDQFLDEIRESVEVAQRVGATWMTVVPGHVDMRLDMNYQELNLIDALKRASEILEPHGLVMVLEPLNTLINHPGMILTKIAQANRICKHVGSPSCKILFDIYHQQITEGNLIPNIDAAWDEIPYFQLGDNPGRNEPYTGEINYRNIFKHLYNKGFDGIVGMEHGKSMNGEEGELALIDAYVRADDFEV